MSYGFFSLLLLRNRFLFRLILLSLGWLLFVEERVKILSVFTHLKESRKFKIGRAHV